MNLTNGYNGHLTSREAGSVGGQMVKKMCPVRSANYLRPARTADMKMLIYNAPLEYAQLVLGGGLEEYLNGTPEHRLRD